MERNNTTTQTSGASNSWSPAPAQAVGAVEQFFLFILGYFKHSFLSLNLRNKVFSTDSISTS